MAFFVLSTTPSWRPPCPLAYYSECVSSITLSLPTIITVVLQKTFLLFFLESFTKHKGSCILCSSNTTANYWWSTSTLLSLLWNTLRSGNRLGQKNIVQKPRWLIFIILKCKKNKKWINRKKSHGKRPKA